MKNLKDVRIVFMGTPDFAVSSLAALLRAGCNVVGVITAPDKPSGRGLQMNQSAVKKFALEHHLHILQPEKLKNPEFLAGLRSLEADIQVVVAFRMLPELVWNMPPMGTINVHGSLLPQYRGAAPINRAIMNGEKETGVTTFKLTHQIDTGNILLQEKIKIGDDETAGELHDRMKETGAELLVKTIAGLVEGNLKEIQQSEIPVEALKHAPKIFTEDCRIDFSKTAAEVHNLIRGLSPFPGAFTQLNEKIFKIFRSQKHEGQHSLSPGTIDTDGKTFLRFACSDAFINVNELQLEGKRKMMTEEFLRGYRF